MPKIGRNERSEIIDLMVLHGITYPQLAAKVGMKPNQLRYRLTDASGDDIPMNLYMDLMDALKKLGVDTNNNIECRDVVEVTLQANVAINRELSELNEEIRAITADGVIDQKERARLKKRLTAIREDYNNKFSELEDLLR